MAPLSLVRIAVLSSLGCPRAICDAAAAQLAFAPWTCPQLAFAPDGSHPVCVLLSVRVGAVGCMRVWCVHTCTHMYGMGTFTCGTPSCVANEVQPPSPCPAPTQPPVTAKLSPFANATTVQPTSLPKVRLRLTERKRATTAAVLRLCCCLICTRNLCACARTHTGTRVCTCA